MQRLRLTRALRAREESIQPVISNRWLLRARRAKGLVLIRFRPQPEMHEVPGQGDLIVHAEAAQGLWRHGTFRIRR